MYPLQSLVAACRMAVRRNRGQHDGSLESRGRRWAVLAVLSAAQFRGHS
jgi:hypothetical protein